MTYYLLLLLIPLLGGLSLPLFKRQGSVRLIALLITLINLGAFILIAIRAQGEILHPVMSCPLFLCDSLSLVPPDGLSRILLFLTITLFPVITAVSFYHDYSRPAWFYALILLLEFALTGVFLTGNAIVFYIFWEIALILAWLLCGNWGGENRIRITFKFFIYTFTGSLLLLFVILYVWIKSPGAESFDFRYLYHASLSVTEQTWLFIAMFVAFGVKIPLFPLHTWQPATYSQSPLAGTLILSAIMVKMGTYGLLRIMLPFTQGVFSELGMVAMGISICGIIYASVIALQRSDMRYLFAWSSIAHTGLIAAAIFSGTYHGIQGAMIQMLAHGFTIAGMFIMADIIERRTGSRTIGNSEGIARTAPRFAVFFMLFCLAMLAFPLTSGFTGEFLMLMGLFEWHPLMAALAGTTIIFSAVYILRLYNKSMLGPSNGAFADLRSSEILLLLPLIAMILWIGTYPAWFMDMTAGSTEQFVRLITP
jgi:NADH-quinone oxidoreductase subunit M